MRKISAIVLAAMLAASLTAASCSPASTPTPTAAPVAARLAFTTQPSGGTAGSVFSAQPVVTVLDASGKVVSAPQALVTLTITPDTGVSRALLFGAAAVGSVNGVVAFKDISIDVAGSGYTLTASSRGLTPAVSSPFDIAPDVAVRLVFTKRPTGATAGSAFTSQPVVTIEDAHGNTVTASTAPVTVAITPGTGASGAVLYGNKTVNAVSGVAAFKDLSLNVAEFGYTLTATSGGLSPAVSDPLFVDSAAATKLTFAIQPDGAKAKSPFVTQPVVNIVDAYGNAVSDSRAPVTLAITPGAGVSGASLSGTTKVNAVHGVAEFADLSIDIAGPDYTLTATSTGFTATSKPFNVAAK